tara:strand:- start:80 stop:187 length:108 start_codon:yes stop_codon:yes gene_type:complete
MKGLPFSMLLRMRDSRVKRRAMRMVNERKEEEAGE